MKSDEDLSELARLIATRVEDVSFRKSQREIANEVGFVNRNMLSLIKSGMTKLSLDRVPAMAKALNLELDVVLMPALRQYYSEDVISMFRDAFGSAETETERHILAIARKHMDTSRSLSYETRTTLKEVFKANKSAKV